MSQLSSVQLSPNRVRLDFDIDMMDVFPVFPVLPSTDRYLPLVSPVSSLGAPAAGSLPDVAAALFDSTIGSLATSLSSIDHAVNLQLLSPPLIPLPDTVLLHTNPTLLLEPTYHLPLTTISFHCRSRFPQLTHRWWCCPGKGHLIRRPSRLLPEITR